MQIEREAKLWYARPLGQWNCECQGERARKDNLKAVLP
jgi:hypothetical protein